MSTRRRAAWFALVGSLIAARVVAAPVPAAPTDIAITVEEGDIVVEAELVPGKPLPFIFDSGLSDGNLVTEPAARALGLKADGNLDLHSANGAKGSAGVTRIPRIRIGTVSLTDQPTAIAPIPDAVTVRPGKAPIAGFIGAPLLQDAVLCLDYGGGRMRRWSRPAFTGEGLASSPMPLRHGLPTIDVDIDGRRAALVVDTGSNGAITLFPSFVAKPDVARRYGGFAGGHAEADAVTLADGSGFNHVPLSTGAQALDPAWGIDGLIGSTMLSQLEPCLDRDGQRILWRP